MNDQRKCRHCGCTELQACPGGCYWVAQDECSACTEPDVFQPNGHQGVRLSDVLTIVKNSRATRQQLRSALLVLLSEFDHQQEQLFAMREARQ